MVFDGELPVENVGDGEGTVIAGTPNKYLNINQALTCPIARAYLVREYFTLSLDDQRAYMAEMDAAKLAVLGALVANDFGGLAVLAYVGVVKSPDQVIEFMYHAQEELERRGYDTREKQEAFAQEVGEKMDQILAEAKAKDTAA